MVLALVFTGCTDVIDNDNGENGDPVNGVNDENGDNGENGEGNGEDIATASSLQFTAQGEDEQGEYKLTWRAKDIGQPFMKIRVEGVEYGEIFGFIVNGETRTTYILEDGVWEGGEPVPEEYWNIIWDMQTNLFDSFHDALIQGQDVWVNPDTAEIVALSEVIINPELDDSLFEPV